MAEVMSFTDLKELGSEANVKAISSRNIRNGQDSQDA